MYSKTEQEMYEQKQISMKRLNKYASIINFILSSYNIKSCDETMMIKGYRKSNIESTNRKTHSENLEAIAGILAEHIGLNVPVVKIMAKHHDKGHTFLGHSGEWWLSEIKKNLGLGYYVHNSLGVRELMYRNKVADEIKSNLYEMYIGNNANTDEDIEKVCEDLWIIFDGINSHNGELSESTYIPNMAKGKADFEQELMKCHVKEGYDKTLVPATSEGCLMRLCDKISYIPFDMVDGLREGMIDKLDEEYIDVLVPILTHYKNMKPDEAIEFINTSVEKQEYNKLAQRLQTIFVKDVWENSNKEKISMSKQMSEYMHKLREINNKKIVNYVLMKEDHVVYPKALEEFMHEFKDIIISENILNGPSEDLTEKYKDSPYLDFIKYVNVMNDEELNWAKQMITLARNEAISSEMNEAFEIVRGNKQPKNVTGEEKRQERVRIYAELYKRQIPGLNCNLHDVTETELAPINEFIKKMAIEKSMYENDENSLALEIGAQYLASLTDTEFMDLLRNSKKIHDIQYKSLTRKYKEIDLQKEYMTHKEWEGMLSEQSSALYGNNEKCEK